MINVGPLFIPHDKVVLFMLTYMGRGGQKAFKYVQYVLYGCPLTASSATPKSREMGWIPR